jgi:hypothetical protein
MRGYAYFWYVGLNFIMKRKGHTHSKIGSRGVTFDFCAKAITSYALLVMKANTLVYFMNMGHVLVSCALFTVYENNLFLLLQAEGKLIFIYRDNIFCLYSCFK